MEGGSHQALEPLVEEAVRATIRHHVDPWLLFGSMGVKTHRLDGTEIAYHGIEYEGSPSEVFWSRGFIDPYLRAMIDLFVAQATKTARELGHDVGIVLHDLQGMLESGIQRIYERMSEVDQRLRGKGFPSSVPRKSIDHRVLELKNYLTSKIKAEHSVELMHARTIMIQSSAKASASIDTFSSWLLAGFAAFASVIVTNQEKIRNLLEPHTVALCLATLAAVVFLGISQKVLGVLIAARAAGDAVGRDIADRGEAVSGLSVMVTEITKGALPIFRKGVSRRLLLVLSGDLAADGRDTFRKAQWQSILVVVQTLLIFALVATLACTAWKATSASTQKKQAEIPISRGVGSPPPPDGRHGNCSAISYQSRRLGW